jgi:hypothetical protein
MANDGRQHRRAEVGGDGTMDRWRTTVGSIAGLRSVANDGRQHRRAKVGGDGTMDRWRTTIGSIAGPGRWRLGRPGRCWHSPGRPARFGTMEDAFDSAPDSYSAPALTLTHPRPCLCLFAVPFPLPPTWPCDAAARRSPSIHRSIATDLSPAMCRPSFAIDPSFHRHRPQPCDAADRRSPSTWPRDVRTVVRHRPQPCDVQTAVRHRPGPAMCRPSFAIDLGPARLPVLPS